ncbi:MAG: NAD(P)/FAD-dependent oxidoreductase [Lachnospiraceae bacterium]|nr:NAD(P)/FAD-dependent oxidoreductase [Lachnospiraceae bacterium]
MKNKCIVIGGGAAGMMAALALADGTWQVELLEKNEKLGKKIYITGKGRCNVTNDCEADTFFANVVSNPKFLYSAYYTFDNTQMMQFLEENGCPLKIERGNRVFPVSDHSSDIIRTLQNALLKKNVKISLHTEVKNLLIENGRVCGVELSDGKKIPADAVVVATGGVSYSSTGSTGDGYRFAEDCGHKITEVKPALVPFTVKESWPLSLQGLALKNVEITVKDGKKEIYNGFGEMLFTHFGISGPLILSASSYYCKKYFGKEVQLFVDLKPALSTEQLDKRILRDFEEKKNKQLKNALDGLLPAKMIPVIIQLAQIPGDKYVHDITREERQLLVELLKNLPITVTGTRPFNEAIITQGGISVKDINPSTMESKLIKNLYFAGEVLDLDAMTGGFNLQIAWSTGYLAGMSIRELK